ncbi:MAG TPA: peptidoglycan-binding domain-containing protein [Candidatus Paceibacterota bacterium]|nr:peptidoglycan-binding domain-containing protein [Candidatus Paceibacterota bacterium]
MKTTQRKADRLVIAWVLTIGALVFGAFAFAHAQTTMVTMQLGPGDAGTQVTALQQFLAQDTSVYPEGLTTGYYGDLTTAAVQRYQCKYSIVCQGDVASTGYGRVGPATLAEIETQEGISPGNGVSLPPTSTPVTGPDVNAPVLSWPTVSTSSASAIISWTTNEPANSSILYATVPPTLSAAGFAAMTHMTASTLGMSPSVILSGLVPNTRYYYVIESVDPSGNIQYGIDHSFVTNS